MASVVRSRRAEVTSPFQVHSHSPRHHRSQPQRRMPIATTASSRQNILHNTVQNTKRARDVSETDIDPIKSKKSRISIELLAKSTRKPDKAPPTATARAAAPAVNKPAAPAATGNKNTAKTNGTAKTEPPANTKHQEKVIKGLKHELKELQPSEPATKEQGRKLRSQEATRFKSELSAYFPDYDEVIGNDPKEEHILNIETPIVLVAGQPLPDSSKGQTPPHGSIPRGQNYAPHSFDKWPVRGYRDALFTDLWDAQVINFGFLEAQYKGRTPNDPLPDSYFEPAHKKAERLERSIRNSEKGRAQHEKDQIIRLLEGLQGHDWLRTMGVSGITESRKKAFEPARAHFIKGCKAILEKFRLWSQEEKRRKLEKDRALAEEARAKEKESNTNSEEEESDEEDEEESESESESEDDADSETSPSSADHQTEQTSRTSSDRTSEGDSRENSDVDAHIEKQLRNDILMASSKPEGKNSKQRRAAPPRQPTPEPPPPPREFTSFFEKKYQRDAALSKSRRKGRTVLAWGHPVPEPPEADFDLPEELRDVETLRSQARRKRRDRRGGKP